MRDSLQKLQTDYIDLLYVHWWDWTTSIEELIDSLHILVEQGKVLYLGISDTQRFSINWGRKIEHLHDNIKALSIHLTEDQIKSIESVKPLELSFPLNIIGEDPRETGVTPPTVVTSAQMAWQRAAKPIGHEL